MEFILSEHAKCVLKERDIREEWVWQTIRNSDRKERRSDNNIHYFKGIPEHGNRILHVVVNPDTIPPKVVTLFFDRKEGMRNEVKS
ncbi:MAG: DUF4258 domain-containing protein [Candidatus Omnitrophota bacterium]